MVQRKSKNESSNPQWKYMALNIMVNQMSSSKGLGKFGNRKIKTN